jgi:hypothetical protein
VGTVVGTVAASLIGSPLIGGAYKVAGYVIGFASGDACRRADSVLKTGGSPKETHSSTSTEIKEEDI